jgi:RimJ/RimL family protein N-acetyltransferase
MQGIWRIDQKNSRGEIGYMLGKTYQGKGLMTEALVSVLRFGFTKAGLHSVEANVNPGNDQFNPASGAMRLCQGGLFQRELLL